jgi:CRISPR/Cas system-associated exonuclease Cas4 (RecB family)
VNAPIKPDELHFSVTQLKTWMLCPKKFEYRYITGAEPEFAPMPLAFGSAFHTALAHHYQWLMRGEPAPADEVKQRFIDAMTLAKNGPVPLQEDEEGTGFEDAVKKGLQMLDVTLSHPTAQPVRVVGVEQPFVVDLYDVETGEVIDEKLKGVIDLVVEEDGNRVLVEHKTSGKKYTVDQLVYDTQLSAYGFAAEQLGWGEVGLRFSVTTKTKLPQVQVEDVRRDDGDQSDFLRQAAGVLKAVDVGISFPVRGWACKSCPYRSRCSAER